MISTALLLEITDKNADAACLGKIGNQATLTTYLAGRGRKKRKQLLLPGKSNVNLVTM